MGEYIRDVVHNFITEKNETHPESPNMMSFSMCFFAGIPGRGRGCCCDDDGRVDDRSLLLFAAAAAAAAADRSVYELLFVATSPPLPLEE
jgi:hypothetical protein